MHGGKLPITSMLARIHLILFSLYIGTAVFFSYLVLSLCFIRSIRSIDDCIGDGFARRDLGVRRSERLRDLVSHGVGADDEAAAEEEDARAAVDTNNLQVLS